MANGTFADRLKYAMEKTGKKQVDLIRLAEEKNVPVEYYPLVHYKACGIIRQLADA